MRARLLVALLALEACTIDPFSPPPRHPRDASDDARIDDAMDATDLTEPDAGDDTSDADANELSDTGPDLHDVADAACASGLTRCGDACVSLSTDVAHCGACGAVCTFATTAAACVAGTCRPAGCLSDLADCDGNPANGCESDLRAAATCGTCATRCAPSEGCVAGSCRLMCATGQMACGGACVSVDRDTAHCGACGRACETDANTSANTCSGGACHPTCVAGFADCDANPTNGCETYLGSLSNCGTCGTACNPGFSCTGSVGRYTCSAVCGDPGQTCCASDVCRGARCSAMRSLRLCCILPMENCDGTCVNLWTSATHCGDCGTRCVTGNGTTTNVCTSSMCQPTCAAHYADCDGNPANGCETSLTTNAHCGACTQGCVAGVSACVVSGTTARCAAL